MVLGFKNNFQEIFRYREVLSNILSQELKVKYKRTFFGYFWSLLNPLMQLSVLALVFSHIVNRGIGDYSLYLFSGLLAWNFFQSTAVTSATCLLENENFIKKIYLPKIIFPLSKLLVKGVDFAFSFVALAILAVVFGFHFSWVVLMLPFAIVLLFCFTLGISLLASVMTIYFRDVQYLMGVFLQLLYFATPIMYPVNMLPERYAFYLGLNPMYRLILIFQKILHAGVMPTSTDWLVASLISFGTLLVGLLFLNNKDEDLVFRM